MFMSNMRNFLRWLDVVSKCEVSTGNREKRPEGKMWQYRYALVENWNIWQENTFCVVTITLKYNWDYIMGKWRDPNVPFLNWRWARLALDLIKIGHLKTFGISLSSIININLFKILEGQWKIIPLVKKEIEMSVDFHWLFNNSIL